MKAVIFLNGDAPSVEEIQKCRTAPLIIAADGAYDYLKGIIAPTVLLGDFDSTSRPESYTCEVITYPVEKDYTDGYLAVELALSRGATDIDIYGAFGGSRADHFYANFSLLYQAKKGGARARLIDENQTVTLERGEFTLPVRVGATLSIEPFFESAHIIQTKGLKYPMRSVTLNREHILGISNEATEDSVTVTAEQEVLVFILK